MNYLVVGVNHKTAPIAVREKLAISGEGISSVLKALVQEPCLHEVALLSTCNRTEVYTVTDQPDHAHSILKNFFVQKQADVGAYLYSKEEKNVIAHLFRVAASLDSLVVGENQITKQVREAYKFASQCATTGAHLNRLFHRALFLAKRVKTETAIGEGNVSVGSVGVVLAKKIFGSLKDKSVLLLGAGEIGQLVLKHLNQFADIEETFIINRSFEKAKSLEAQGLGIAHRWEDLKNYLLKADIFITSLAAGFDFLDYEFFTKVMAERKNDPLFVIDLGVPRNINPEVERATNVYLYNIDDLKKVSEENKDLRDKEKELAEKIIHEEAEIFYETYVSKDALPMIASLNQKFELLRRQELERTFAKMPHWEEEDREQVEIMTRALVAKILHGPIFHLKQKKNLSETGVLSILKKIFSLEDEDKS